MNEFKAELAVLLRKHGVYIVAKSNSHKNDMSVEIGFMDTDLNTNWTDRHHLGAYDIDGRQGE